MYLHVSHGKWQHLDLSQSFHVHVVSESHVHVDPVNLVVDLFHEITATDPTGHCVHGNWVVVTSVDVGGGPRGVGHGVNIGISMGGGNNVDLWGN